MADPTTQAKEKTKKKLTELLGIELDDMDISNNEFQMEMGRAVYDTYQEVTKGDWKKWDEADQKKTQEIMEKHVDNYIGKHFKKHHNYDWNSTKGLAPEDRLAIKQTLGAPIQTLSNYFIQQGSSADARAPGQIIGNAVEQKKQRKAQFVGSQLTREEADNLAKELSMYAPKGKKVSGELLYANKDNIGESLYNIATGNNPKGNVIPFTVKDQKSQKDTYKKAA